MGSYPSRFCPIGGKTYKKGSSIKWTTAGEVLEGADFRFRAEWRTPNYSVG